MKKKKMRMNKMEGKGWARAGGGFGREKLDGFAGTRLN